MDEARLRALIPDGLALGEADGLVEMDEARLRALIQKSF